MPWQAWYANLGGNPTPGKSTFKPKNSIMYFLGVKHLCEAFIPMWDRIHAQLHTNKVVGCAFPNDSDGNAFRAALADLRAPGRLHPGRPAAPTPTD